MQTFLNGCTIHADMLYNVVYIHHDTCIHKYVYVRTYVHTEGGRGEGKEKGREGGILEAMQGAVIANKFLLVPNVFAAPAAWFSLFMVLY